MALHDDDEAIFATTIDRDEPKLRELLDRGVSPFDSEPHSYDDCQEYFDDTGIFDHCAFHCALLSDADKFDDLLLIMLEYQHVIDKVTDDFTHIFILSGSDVQKWMKILPTLVRCDIRFAFEEMRNLMHINGEIEGIDDIIRLTIDSGLFPLRYLETVDEECFNLDENIAKKIEAYSHKRHSDVVKVLCGALIAPLARIVASFCVPLCLVEEQEEH